MSLDELEQMAAQMTRDKLAGKIGQTLARLRECCWHPRPVPPSASIGESARLRVTLWPTAEQLVSLDVGVFMLANPNRKIPPPGELLPPGQSRYERVNIRYPRLRLKGTLTEMLARARARLVEAGEGERLALVAKAMQGGPDAPLIWRFLKDQESVMFPNGEWNPAKSCSQINWEEYEPILRWRDAKEVHLACGGTASPAVFCYTRALEIAVEYHKRQELHKNVSPLLGWVRRLGDPNYDGLLSWDGMGHFEAAIRASEQLKQSAHVRTLAKKRKRKERERKKAGKKT